MLNQLNRFTISSIAIGWMATCVTGMLVGNWVIPEVALSKPSHSENVAQQPNCTDPQTQTDMNLCAGLSWRQADRTLNRTYRELLPKLSSSPRQQLIGAQQAWIRFRDAECNFAGSAVAGGTMQPMVISGCQEQLTRQRTADFNAYLKRTIPPAGKASYAQADRTLNQRYQQLKQLINRDRVRSLETAELAWITFRDRACDFEATQPQPASRNQCLVRLTEQRTQQLQDHLRTN